MDRLEGKVAIVVGAASGLGVACALRLGDEGARVVVADINEEGAARTADSIRSAGGEATSCQVDLANEDAVRAMVEVARDAFGGVDVLHLNAAATGSPGLAEEVLADIRSIPMDSWRRTLDVNTTGFMLGCRYAVPEMIARGGGSIIMTNSAAGFRGEHVRGAYATSKAALIGLMNHVATAFGKANVRCNCVAPGAMLTPEYRGETPGSVPWPKPFHDLSLRQTLLPRVGNEHDIANAVLFLASDESAFITGHNLVVDGGFSAHVPTWADFAGAGETVAWNVDGIASQPNPDRV